MNFILKITEKFLTGNAKTTLIKYSVGRYPTRKDCELPTLLSVLYLVTLELFIFLFLINNSWNNNNKVHYYY